MAIYQQISLAIIFIFALIQSTQAEYSTKTSDTYQEDNHWAEYPTMNSSHTCDSCYNSQKWPNAANCIDWEFKQSVCCNHTITLPDGSKSDLQDRCMAKFTYCTKGLEQSRYKKLTCAARDCPKWLQDSNENKHPWYLEQRKLEESPIYRTASMDYQANAVNCKMIFNATKEINGKQTLIFKKLDEGAIVNLYKMPAWNKTAFPQQHGFPRENDDVTPITKDDVQNSKAFEAPSDWTLLVTYSFGPDKTQIETKSSLTWYRQDDDAKVKKLWIPTNTYFQKFINCTGDKLTDQNETQADLTKCQAEKLPFIPRCCSGTKDGTQFNYWCLPNTFQAFQYGSSWQGLTFNCPFKPSEQQKQVTFNNSETLLVGLLSLILSLSIFN